MRRRKMYAVPVFLSRRPGRGSRRRPGSGPSARAAGRGRGL
jgi:hypothetical protein